MGKKKSFASVILEAKASFFDGIYREQHLVELLTSKLENYTPEEQIKLKELFNNQAKQAERLVKELEDIVEVTNGLAKIGNEIKEIIGTVDLELAVEKINDQVPTTEDIGLTQDASLISAASDELQEKETIPSIGEVTEESSMTDDSISDSASIEKVPEDVSLEAKDDAIVSTGEVEQSIETNSDGDLATDVMDPVKKAIELEVPGVTANNSVTPTMEIGMGVVDEAVVPTIDSKVDTNENVAEVAKDVQVDIPVVAVTPTASDPLKVSEEVSTTETQQPNIISTNLTVEQPNVVSQETNVNSEVVEEPKPFALSPIDEGVTLAPVPSVGGEDSLVAAPIEQVVTESINNSVLPAIDSSSAGGGSTAAVENTSMIKYTKIGDGPAKAILVTAAQYDKLIGSRETQKALVNSKTDAGVVTPVSEANVVADEQTLMANGLLTPTESATKMEMEGILAQANALYKEGKTAEAQELYNKVSAMNQTMQSNAVAGAVEPAKVLVNTPTVPPVVAA